MTGVRTAVLDLGSNSFHVLVADVEGGRVVPVLRQREMLHLGAVVARHGHVPADACEAAADTAGHLAELARRAGAADVAAVATAAIRDAANGRAVLGALEAATGVTVRVLPGEEEARLSYLGVRSAVAVTDEPVLVLDLGGGSLEFAVGRGAQVTWSTSTPLGSSRLTTVVEHDPPTDDERRRLRATVADEIDPLTPTIAELRPATVVAVGGTIRALARVAAAATGTWLPAESVTNQFEVSTGELRHVRDHLLTLDQDGRLQVPGMKASRADHLHVAAVVLVEVLERLSIDAVTIADAGLREGLLLDAAGAAAVPPAAQLRAREVARVRETFLPGDPHPTHVGVLAGLLFDDLVDLHGLGDDDRELLVHAAELHTIGESLALRRSHRHGAYLLEHAELRGFAPAEVATLAILVRFHGARGIDRNHPPAAGIDQARTRRTERLLALLQLADVLDGARDQAVHDVHAVDDGETVTVGVNGDPHLDVADLRRRADWFARALGRGLRLVDEASGAPLA